MCKTSDKNLILASPDVVNTGILQNDNEIFGGK